MGGSLFGLMMALNAYRFQYGVDDAFWRTLMSPFEGTVWALQFDEAGFSKIRVGMAAADVVKLIGNPLRKDCDSADCFWIYTWHDSATADFDQRWVVVGASDRVSEIRKSFFID
jgi:hypothetical protein